MRDKYYGLGTALHAVETISTGAAIALTGQIFNINEHWPAAVLMWALAALAGWALLRDQAQQTLALLLVPAWMLSEFEYHAEGHIGTVYDGRLLFVWSILYLTFFVGSRRKVVQGILFAASVVASITGVIFMIETWTSWGPDQAFLPFGLRVWAWIAIAAVPLAVAAFHGHKGLIPIATAIAFTIALPWCHYLKAYTYTNGNGYTQTYYNPIPNLAAHAVVAGFAVFLCWWGARIGSRLLVNFGIVGFALTVGWFYYSDILDKFSRSLGLIGLGVLFLAGGWGLEKVRRRIMAGMGKGSGVSGVSGANGVSPRLATSHVLKELARVWQPGLTRETCNED